MNLCPQPTRTARTQGDVVIDCGNEWFELTERRQAALARRGVHFMGCGTSGGERGARLGPCLMPSGDRKAWDLVKPILEAIAARVPEPAPPAGGGGGGSEGAKANPGAKAGAPCVCYIGPGGSGHYVKMVHNGA